MWRSRGIVIASSHSASKTPICGRAVARKRSRIRQGPALPWIASRRPRRRRRRRLDARGSIRSGGGGGRRGLGLKLVLRPELEVARVVTLVQLAGEIPAGPVDDASPLDR